MPTSLLLEPIKIGEMHLKNRIVMEPLTRMRANENNVALPIMAAYFASCTNAGLLITDATQVAPEGRGYSNTPGIKRGEQLIGWKRVTHEVHRKGGRIFCSCGMWGVIRIRFFSRKENFPWHLRLLARSVKLKHRMAIRKCRCPKRWMIRISNEQ